MTVGRVTILASALLAGAVLASPLAAAPKVAAGARQSVPSVNNGPLPRSGCRVRGFLVNDYGKIGPTNDAKALLDTDIAKWMATNRITKYKTGPKTVSCEKYLDFGFFDEWTCTASARVCW
jgi:hypothetical protein